MAFRLLITGHTGVIGRILWHALKDTFELYGVDIRRDASTENAFQADISDPGEIEAVFKQIAQLSHVVHLAGDPRADADWQSVWVNNIAGTRNVYEAARMHGVKRVVFASSNHVTGAYEGFPPSLHTQPNPALITPQHPIRPDGYYGAGKAAGEAIARMYYELHGIESVCLRIGTVLEDDDPTKDPRHASTWLSHRDLIQLVKKSLLAEVGYAVYYGVSNNEKRFWDISNAEAEIGYQPESDASRYKRNGPG
jgi:nucleoside-diphosphate-sugar epimerase